MRVYPASRQIVSGWDEIGFSMKRLRQGRVGTAPTDDRRQAENSGQTRRNAARMHWIAVLAQRLQRHRL